MQRRHVGLAHYISDRLQNLILLDRRRRNGNVPIRARSVRAGNGYKPVITAGLMARTSTLVRFGVTEDQEVT